MRKTCLDHVHLLAKKDRRVVFIGSDLGVGTLDAFRQEFPERFFMEGISEANIVGMAAGLAMEGRIVYVNTIAPFFTRRALDQIVIDLCLHDLPVRLIANGGGLVYAPLGPTHETTEDIAVMRAIPNMTIVAPSDAAEMARFMPQTLDWPHPIYIRLAKGFDPVVSNDQTPFAIGRGIAMAKGRDALAVTTGITLKLALEARETLATSGIDLGVLHLPTVKPLDAALLLAMAAPVRAIIAVEEHSVIGGLGGVLAEILAEWEGFAGKRFKRLGLPDAFPDQYGSQATLMTRCGLTAENLAATVSGLCRP
ncbi:MAG: transketolase family protein [Solidesulfovibrio sp.]